MEVSRAMITDRHVLVDCAIGEVEVMANREEIAYTDHTCRLVEPCNALARSVSGNSGLSSGSARTPCRDSGGALPGVGAKQ